MKEIRATVFIREPEKPSGWFDLRNRWEFLVGRFAPEELEREAIELPDWVVEKFGFDKLDWTYFPPEEGKSTSYFGGFKAEEVDRSPETALGLVKQIGFLGKKTVLAGVDEKTKRAVSLVYQGGSLSRLTVGVGGLENEAEYVGSPSWIKLNNLEEIWGVSSEIVNEVGRRGGVNNSGWPGMMAVFPVGDELSGYLDRMEQQGYKVKISEGVFSVEYSPQQCHGRKARERGGFVIKAPLSLQNSTLSSSLESDEFGAGASGGVV
jgi:hypothetical protein